MKATHPDTAKWDPAEAADTGLGGQTIQIEGASLFYQPGGVASLDVNESLDEGALFGGRYRIEAELGRGGFGIVYRGFDTSPLQRKVAVKVIRMAHGRGGESASRGRRQFLEEVKLAGSLNHPNIATIFDVGEHEGNIYMTQELVDGEDLGALINREGVLPLRRILDLSRQMCAGVHHAHLQGIVHRDIKPANMLIDKKGCLRLTDFGLAKAQSGSAGAERSIVGTPGFMAPEQLSGDEVDCRADVFALGCVVYQLVTGKVPFTGKTLSEVAQATFHRVPPSPSSLRGDVPRGMDKVLERAMAKGPGDRYDDVESFLEELLHPERYDYLLDPRDAVGRLLEGGDLGSMAIVVGRHVPTGAGAPSGESVESLLLDQLASQAPELEIRGSFYRLAQDLEMERGREEVLRSLGRALTIPRVEEDEVARIIGELGAPWVLTTRYDEGLARALKVGTPGGYRQVTGRGLGDDNLRGPLLVSLFGNAQDDDSLVVTEDDVWDFCNTVFPRMGGLKALLERRRILLVGFDLEGECFKQICLQLLKASPGRDQEIFVVGSQITAEGQRWAERRGLRLVDDSAPRFLERLRRGSAGLSLSSTSLDGIPPSSLGGPLSMDGPQPPLGEPCSSAQESQGGFRQLFDVSLRVILIAVCVLVGAKGAGLLGDEGNVGIFHGDGAQGAVVEGVDRELEGGGGGAEDASALGLTGLEDEPEALDEGIFRIVIAPFWGVDEETQQRGRVLQVLAESKIRSSLAGAEDVEVLGKVQAEAPQSYADAQALGETLGADAVLWGEVMVMGNTMLVQPYITQVEPEFIMNDDALTPLQVNLDDTDQLRLNRMKTDEMGQLALMVAGRHFLTREPLKALSFFQRIHPETSESIALQGDALLRQGLSKRAESYLALAVEMDPNNAHAYARMGWLYWYEGQVEQAFEVFERAAEIDDSNPSRMLSLGLIHEFQGNLERAEHYFQRARTISSEDETSYQALFRVLSKLGRHDDVRALVEESRQLPGRQSLYTTFMASIYRERGDIDGADEVFEEALRVDPTNSEIMAAYGWHLHNLNRYEGAKERFRQALEIEPQNKGARFGLAVGREFEGDEEGALREYSMLTQGAKFDFRPYHAMARVLGKLGRYEEALGVLKEAFRRAPPPAYAASLRATMAGIYTRLGRFDEAIEEYRKAMRLTPSEPTIHLSLGVVYEQQGRLEDAAEIYQAGHERASESCAWPALFNYVTVGRLGGDLEAAKALLVQRLESKQVETWPKPILEFFIYDRDDQFLLDAALAHGDEDGATDLHDLETWYYLGMKARLEGRNEDALMWFGKIMDDEREIIFEFQSAKAEIPRILAEN